MDGEAAVPPVYEVGKEREFSSKDAKPPRGEEITKNFASNGLPIFAFAFLKFF
jgi:hypothetical protein